MPVLNICLEKINFNINYIQDFCLRNKLKLMLVIKVLELCDVFIEFISKINEKNIGVSDILAAKKIKDKINVKATLLTIPSLANVDEVITYCQASLNSEWETIQELAKQCDKRKVYHEIILMIDIGDLREGVMPQEAILFVKNCISLTSAYFKIKGIGANLGCGNCILPTYTILNILQIIKNEVQEKYSYILEVISIGGSIILEWMNYKYLPSCINQLRIGEAAFLGSIPVYHKQHPHLFDDAFILIGTIVELKVKQVIVEGKAKVQVRAILDFGNIHTIPNKLSPTNNNMVFIKSTSNYSIYDVTSCEQNFSSGDKLNFRLNYSALAQANLSPYVVRNYIN